MAKTYTEHKLTDPMLQRLSKICKGKPAGGISLGALEQRNLIERTIDCATHGVRCGIEDDCGCGGARLTWLATPAGTRALAQARAEGW